MPTSIEYPVSTCSRRVEHLWTDGWKKREERLTKEKENI